MLSTAGLGSSSKPNEQVDVLSQDQPWLLYVYSTHTTVDLFVEFSVSPAKQHTVVAAASTAAAIAAASSAATASTAQRAYLSV